MGCLLFLLVLFINWAITCLFVWLITLCFSLDFSFAGATGIWLIIMFLSSAFRNKK